MARKTKLEGRKVRHRSIRKRIEGTSERPRLVIFRSAKHIYAQVVDDLSRTTLVSASDLGETSGVEAGGKKTDRAKAVGANVAKRLLEKGIKKVVFDRAGYKYHGRVSAVAEGAREAGLEF